MDGLVSGSLVETSRGPLAIAFGAQLRRESITGDLNDQFNAENYLFLIGGPDFSGHRTVVAGFSEFNIP